MKPKVESRDSICVGLLGLTLIFLVVRRCSSSLCCGAGGVTGSLRGVEGCATELELVQHL